MFERFTDRARKIMAMSNQIAQAHHQDFIVPEHILVALLRDDGGTAQPVLERQNVDLGQLEKDASALLEHASGNSPPGKIPLQPLVKTVIEQAIREARALNHNYVGTEHLLLGLLRLTDPPLPSLFARHGVTLDRSRDIVQQITGKSSTAIPEALTPEHFGSRWSPTPSQEIDAIMDVARAASRHGNRELKPGHILFAILAYARHPDNSGSALCAEALIEWLHRMRAFNPLPDPNVCLDDLRFHLAKKIYEQPPPPDAE